MDKIAFGTGGLRGIMGDEPGNINNEVIQRVTHGLAKVVLSSDAPKSVGIAYDTRYNSAEFAKVTCDTLSAFGIEAYIFDKPTPTPTLSFAIRYLKLGWGVCITASHNPQEYNGYKVYDEHGVQVTDRLAMEITDSINSVGESEDMPQARREIIKRFDDEVVEKYLEQIVSYVMLEEPNHAGRAGARPLQSASPTVPSQNVLKDTDPNFQISIFNFQFPSSYPLVYSALHGTGANAVPTVLERLGFNPVCIQQNPDGAFGGLKTPNPEEPVVYEEAIEKAKETGAKLILATDPDCDRVGVMVRTESGFELLNGNQIGALLIDYLAQTRGVTRGDNTKSCGVVISTIVSGLLGEQVAKEHGLEFVRLLTGFKYIGEYIVNLPEDKHFFFGYEESYGYLAGDGAQHSASGAYDKDAVIASALIAKMAEYYDEKGMTLLDRWVKLSEKHGYCLELLHSVNIPQDKQKEVMSRFRSSKDVLSKQEDNIESFGTGNQINGVTRIEDYLHGFNGLPPADVIKLYFTDIDDSPGIEAWAAIRPSGTEPKLKLYIGVIAETYETAKAALESLVDLSVCILLV